VSDIAVPCDAAVCAEVERVELAAKLLYASYRNQRQFCEGHNLPCWEHLAKHKQDRFRAVARTAITFLPCQLARAS